MTPYPTNLPVDAINVIVTDIKNNAVMADRANFAKAVWELEGYGLRLGLGDPTPTGFQSGPPLTNEEVVAHLEPLLAPEFSFCEAPQGVAQGLPELVAALPWQQILKWSLTLVASLL